MTIGGGRVDDRTRKTQKEETESNSFTDALTAAGVTGYHPCAARWLFFANFESDFN